MIVYSNTNANVGDDKVGRQLLHEEVHDRLYSYAHMFICMPVSVASICYWAQW